MPIKRIFAEIWLLNRHLTLLSELNHPGWFRGCCFLPGLRLCSQTFVRPRPFIWLDGAFLAALLGSGVSPSCSAHPNLQCTHCILPPSLPACLLPLAPSLLLSSILCFLLFPSPHYPPCGLRLSIIHRSARNASQQAKRCLPTPFRVCSGRRGQHPEGF